MYAQEEPAARAEPTAPRRAVRASRPASERSSTGTVPSGSSRVQHSQPAATQGNRDSRQDTRQRVILAAIQCILEQGFYRASSNAIAERAGLTWGVIQYHFGTREALMLAVMEEGTRRFAEDLRTADITGDTLLDRVEEYFDILARYYASPDYLAFIQVLVNLGHDPRTSEQTRQTMTEINETANPELKRLVTKVFAGTSVRRREIRNLLFHALRGLSISHVMLATVPPYTQGPKRDILSERRLLARALALLIEQESARND